MERKGYEEKPTMSKAKMHTLTKPAGMKKAKKDIKTHASISQAANASHFIAKITNVFQDADLNSENEGGQDEDVEDKDMEDEHEAEEYEEMDVGGRKARKSTELPGRRTHGYADNGEQTELYYT